MAELALAGRTYCKPIEYNGNYYVVGIDKGVPSQIACIKSSNPGTVAFAVQDSSNQPVIDNTDALIKAVHYDPQGKFLHVAFQRVRETGVDTTETVFYARFNMSTDAWVILDGGTARQSTVKSPDAGSQVSCYIAAQWDYVAIVYADSTEAADITRTRVGLSTASNTGNPSWTDKGKLDGGAGNNYHQFAPQIYIGDAGDCHCLWTDNSSGFLIKHRSLDNDLTLNAIQSTGVVPVTQWSMGWGSPGVRGAGTVQIPYNNATDLMVLEFDVSDTPSTWTTDLLSATLADEFGGTFPKCQAMTCNDGTVMNAMAVQDSDSIIHLYSDIGSDGNWAFDTTTGTTGLVVGYECYDHDGGVHAAIYAATTDELYYEVGLSVDAGALSTLKVGWNQTNNGPYVYNGSLYAVLVDSDFAEIKILQSTNKIPVDGDWNEVDSGLYLSDNDRSGQDFVGGSYTAQAGYRGLTSIQDGNLIHIFCSQECGPVTHSIFNCSSNTFTTRLEVVADAWATDFNGVSRGVCMASINSAGDILLAVNWHNSTGYAASPKAITGFLKSSGTWSNLGRIDDDSSDWCFTGDIIGPDSLDNWMHIYNNYTASTVKGCYIESDGTVNTVFEVGSCDATAIQTVGRGALIEGKWHIPYTDADTKGSMAKGNMSATPDISVKTAVTHAPIKGNGQIAIPQPANYLQLLEIHKKPRVVYVSADDGFIYIDGQTKPIVRDVTAQDMLSVQYNDALMVIYSDGGTTKYASVNIEPDSPGGVWEWFDYNQSLKEQNKKKKEAKRRAKLKAKKEAEALAEKEREANAKQAELDRLDKIVNRKSKYRMTNKSDFMQWARGDK